VSEGAHTGARPLLRCCDLDINSMTLELEGGLDILKIYLHTVNKVARLRHSKLLTADEICVYVYLHFRHKTHRTAHRHTHKTQKKKEIILTTNNTHAMTFTTVETKHVTTGDLQ